MVREHTGLQGMYLEHIAFYVKIAQLVASGEGCSSKDKQWRGEYLIGKKGWVSLVEIIFEIRVNKS